MHRFLSSVSTFYKKPPFPLDNACSNSLPLHFLTFRHLCKYVTFLWHYSNECTKMTTTLCGFYIRFRHESLESPYFAAYYFASPNFSNLCMLQYKPSDLGQDLSFHVDIIFRNCEIMVYITDIIITLNLFNL